MPPVASLASGGSDTTCPSRLLWSPGLARLIAVPLQENACELLNVPSEAEPSRRWRGLAAEFAMVPEMVPLPGSIVKPPGSPVAV